VCHNYSDLNFGVTFLEHSVYCHFINKQVTQLPAYRRETMLQCGGLEAMHIVHLKLTGKFPITDTGHQSFSLGVMAKALRVNID